MAHWPIDDSYAQVEASATAAAIGTQVVSDATANVFGGWAALIASTAFDAVAFTITIVDETGDTAKDFFVDIGVGAAASEEVICERLMLPSGASPHGAGMTYGPIPIQIPAGTNVSARCLRDTGAGATNCRVAITLYGGTWNARSGGRRLAILNSSGVNVTAGTGLVQIVASTVERYGGMMIATTAFTDVTLAVGNAIGNVEIGASLSEEPIYENFSIINNSQLNNIAQGPVHLLPCDIPAGTRVAFNTLTDAIAEDEFMHIWGLEV